MAKEEDLKRVDLKVSVNCCEGCRKKVLKALSIKGVLRTEIHPTLPKVTVTGNVDTNTLIKKLAKVGKSAEVLASEAAPKPQEEAKPPESGDKNKTEKAGKKEKEKDGNCTGAGNKPTGQLEKNPSVDATKSNGDKKDGAGANGGADKKPSDGADQEKARGHAPEVPDGTYAAIIAGVPQMSYVVSPSMAQNAGSVMASQARVYYPMEPVAMPVAMPYGRPMNPYPAPPPYYVHDGYYYELHQAGPYRAQPTPPPPLLPQSQPASFGDYFNEDNTVGCHVM